MTHHKPAVRAVALVFLAGLFLAGATPPQGAGAHVSEIDRIAKDAMGRQQIPAMTLAIALDGRVIYSKGFGAADVENGVAATAETLIRTGSMAKPITAAAAMTLVEAGKLDLDAPVQAYCPAFPAKQWPVTTRELLTHTSGIRHYKGDEADSTKHYDKMIDGFVIFAADPLLFEPGTRYSYSTYGYTVIGCVIEGASREKYFDHVREHVLAPAGMTHTFVDDAASIVPHRARGYQVKQGRVLNAGPMDSSYKIPGGGLVTTAEDMVRFATALFDGRIVKPQTLAMMLTPTGRPQVDTGKASAYGIGFNVVALDDQKYVVHTGGEQGTSTAVVLIPGRRFAVAVLANDEDADPFDVIRPILDLYRMPRPKPAK